MALNSDNTVAEFDDVTHAQAFIKMIEELYGVLLRLDSLNPPGPPYAAVCMAGTHLARVRPIVAAFKAGIAAGLDTPKRV